VVHGADKRRETPAIFSKCRGRVALALQAPLELLQVVGQGTVRRRIPGTSVPVLLHVTAPFDQTTCKGAWEKHQAEPGDAELIMPHCRNCLLD